MRCGKASSSGGPTRRMKPARQTSRCLARAVRARGRDRSRRETSTADGADTASRCRRAGRARGRRRASTFEMTTAIVASSRPSPIASMSACRLLPRPEMSTPRRRFKSVMGSGVICRGHSLPLTGIGVASTAYHATQTAFYHDGTRLSRRQSSSQTRVAFRERRGLSRFRVDPARGREPFRHCGFCVSASCPIIGTSC